MDVKRWDPEVKVEFFFFESPPMVVCSVWFGLKTAPWSKQSIYRKGLFPCSCSDSQQHLHVECSWDGGSEGGGMGAWEEGQPNGEDWWLMIRLLPEIFLPISHYWWRCSNSSWWRGNSFHGNQARRSSPLCSCDVASILFSENRCSFRRKTSVCRLHFQRAKVFSNHKVTKSVTHTLQGLQNRRFSWHEAWAALHKH